MKFGVKNSVVKTAMAVACLVLSLLPALCLAQSDNDIMKDSLVKLYTNRLLNETEFCKNDTVIFISLARQQMYVIQGKIVLQRYSISSAKNGIGCQNGSFQTPEGIHRIYTKIGHKTKVPYVYSTHSITKKVAKIEKVPRKSKKDFVTSRILWLTGVEEYFNCGGDVDSYNRNVYIHGTTEEGFIGATMSSGCIRMMNEDVIDLYKMIPRLTYVVIMNDLPPGTIIQSQVGEYVPPIKPKNLKVKPIIVGPPKITKPKQSEADKPKDDKEDKSAKVSDKPKAKTAVKKRTSSKAKNSSKHHSSSKSKSKATSKSKHKK